MILVAGATGHLGREICRRLTEQKRAVRGLVRPTSDPEVVARLRSWGVETVGGDLRDPASLEGACRGASAVISTVTSVRSRQPGDGIEATDLQGQLNLVDAARAAAVGRFVYVSYSGQIGKDDPLTRAKRGVEEQLRASGMLFTILRPSYFMEVWLSPTLGFDYEGGAATIYGSGRRRISWISMFDVASFAVECLDRPAAFGAVLELGGPEAISPLDVVRIFEEVGGRRFQVLHVPEDALHAQESGAADSLQKSFTALMLSYAQGVEIPMLATLRTVPVPLRSVREYARQVLPATVPPPAAG